ncbi:MULTISPECIES: cytochrome c biogenesis protein CcdA [unclassified Helicobacter]|uniref:cytochrome c biogenesis protein CcdA n=1 Tax=unclassified Helicobacter TaxID=2593540 RepID=UPI000CF13639|nr:MULTISPECIES: cytochrome c biogenesis protein CcdA [unclassified Helicobacter]
MEQFLEAFFQTAPLFVTLLAGILTFLSPCILPLVPAYMSYICGENLQYLKEQKTSFALFYKALIFTLGFGLIFILFGISSAKIIDVFAPYWIKQLGGVIIIIFGLHFLGILRLSLLYKTKAFNLSVDKKKIFHHILSPFLLGISFALGWTPCLGPIFSSIIILSSSERNFGILLIVVYAIGLAIPFLLVALFIQKAFSLFTKIKKHFRSIEICSGILLIFLGVCILFGWMDKILWIS